MNFVLWFVQFLLGAQFAFLGFFHSVQFDRAVERLKWPADVGRSLMTAIGTLEVLGGIGLILPALTGILPILTPLAATGIALVMLFAIVFHIPRREYPNIGLNLFILALAAFVAYGRFALVPLS